MRQKKNIKNNEWSDFKLSPNSKSLFQLNTFHRGIQHGKFIFKKRSFFSFEILLCFFFCWSALMFTYVRLYFKTPLNSFQNTSLDHFNSSESVFKCMLCINNSYRFFSCGKILKSVNYEKYVKFLSTVSTINRLNESIKKWLSKRRRKKIFWWKISCIGTSLPHIMILHRYKARNK